MPGRRETLRRDRQHNSKARKRSHKETLERAQQQAGVLAKLWSGAKAEAKAPEKSSA